MTAVERHLPRCVLRTGDRHQQPLPDAPLAPLGEAVINGFMGPILGWTIFPAATASLYAHDTAQESYPIGSSATAVQSSPTVHHQPTINALEPLSATVKLLYATERKRAQDNSKHGKDTRRRIGFLRMKAGLALIRLTAADENAVTT